jgi:hypothetical protein
VKNSDLNGKIVPLKTDLEKLLWPLIWELSQQGKHYAAIEDLAETLPINKRSMGGVIASLQKKGWVFAFSDNRGLDLEMTCMARKEMGIEKNKGFCNHLGCFCNIKS